MCESDSRRRGEVSTVLAGRALCSNLPGMRQHTAEDIVRRATAAFNSGKPEEALSLCEQGLAREPGDPTRPLCRVDHDVPRGVALALPPAGVEPDQLVALGLESVRLEPVGLLEDRRLGEAAGQREVGVPAHVRRGREDRRFGLRASPARQRILMARCRIWIG